MWLCDTQGSVQPWQLDEALRERPLRTNWLETHRKKGKSLKVTADNMLQQL